MASPCRQHLPEDLAHTAPGPRLGVLLAGIDPSLLTGPDCVAVMQAWHRPVAHVQARFMEAMVQVGLSRPAPDGAVARDVQPCWQGGDEIRAALAWTRQAAEKQLSLAWDLQSRLPQVHQALVQGRIDQPRARVLSDWTTDLEPEQAEHICALLLPKAGALTTGQLIAQIRQMVIAIDPDWAARRYTEAVKTRRVVGYRTPDGTANLSGLDLPVDQAAAATAHIEALARRAKHAGDGRPIDHIRADLFMGMLDGTFIGCDEQQIIAHLLHQTPDRPADPPDAPPPADTERGRRSTTADGDGPAQQRATGRSDRPPPATDAPGRATGSDANGSKVRSRGQSTEQSTNTEETGQAGRSNPTVGSGETHGTAADATRHGHGQTGETAGASGSRGRDNDARPATARPPSGVELRVKLSTLLGLDRHPAEITGWGYTHAEQARAIAAAQTGAQWRYAICDHRGALLHDGLIRSRPHGYPARTPRRGVVEIQIPLSLLQHLFDHPELHPPWNTIIEQITRDIAVQPDDDESRMPEETGPTGDQRGRPLHGDAAGRDRRFPTSGMRRHVQVRDRYCQFPGCRMPARDTDTDHIRQWLTGGRTLGPNLVSLCRHDHRIKDEGGWRLTRPNDSLLQWTSRLGLTYTVRRPPIIIDLPVPRPGRRSTRHTLEHPTGRGPIVADPGDPAPPGRETQAPIWWEPSGRGGDEGTESSPAQATRADPGESRGERPPPQPSDWRQPGPDDGEEVPF